MHQNSTVRNHAADARLAAVGYGCLLVDSAKPTASENTT